MFTGKTKSGFTYCIPEKRIQNMELLDALTDPQVSYGVKRACCWTRMPSRSCTITCAMRTARCR